MKVALFDLDGTLIDSCADLVLAVNLARRDFGLPSRSAGDVVACIGEGVRTLIERINPECPGLWDAMLARQRAHYSEHCLDNTTLYPGVAETLDALRAAGWRLAVVTNKPGPVTRQILDGLGVTGLFSAVVGGGDCRALKPDPEPLLFAASQMGVTLDGTDWMVGDHFTDLESGRRAGVRRCFCRFGFGDAHGELFDAAIDRMDSFLELADSF